MLDSRYFSRNRLYFRVQKSLDKLITNIRNIDLDIAVTTHKDYSEYSNSKTHRYINKCLDSAD